MSVAADDRLDPTTTRAPNPARHPVGGPATDACGARLLHASGGK